MPEVLDKMPWEVQLVWVVQASMMAVPERKVQEAQLVWEALGVVLGVLAGGIGGNGPNCTGGYCGIYIGCSWGVACHGGSGTGGASCATLGVNQRVQRYSSTTRFKVRVTDANRLSLAIRQGFGKCTNAVGAVGGLAIGGHWIRHPKQG